MTQTVANLSVLVADSSNHMAGLLAQMLRALKVRAVEETTDWVATAAELGRRPYDLLLIDEQLETIDSTELVRKLRNTSTSPNRLIPIIMMSSAPSVARIEAARDAGVTEFLKKPLSARQIEDRLKAILTHPREFIGTPGYSGPDRRRRNKDAAPQRRSGDSPA